MTRSEVSIGFGKLVLSGDSVVIRERAQDGPPTSLTVVLSNISCPKIAKRPNSYSAAGSDDEPFAWMSREFVRSKVIGKEICYIVENEVTPERVYGSIFLGQSCGAPNLAHLLVSEGLGQVRKNMSQSMIEKKTAVQTLLQLEENAKAERKGIWSGSVDGIPRNISWTVDDPTAFFEVHRNKPLRGIVEFVRDGSTMQVLLLPIDGDPACIYHSIMVTLSGIKTPGSKIVDGSRVHDPFSLDAQFYVESRLLQRDVTVILESMSGNAFVGCILHPKGNIALFLLLEGLARCLEWNLGVVSKDAGGAESYRNAEQNAKQKRLRIWQDYQPVTGGHTSPLNPGQVEKKISLATKYTGFVTEVKNGDSVIVKCQDKVTRKFFLASVRPPRVNQDLAKPQQGVRFMSLYAVPNLYEAREFLRKRLIGKQVKVEVDYIQPKPQGSTLDDRVCATITVGDVNIGEALVQRGLGSVVRYRNPTDARARAYDALIAAEAQAEKKGVGMYDSKGAAVHRIVELEVGDAAKSRHFLFSFQRVGPISALVEFVGAASRLRIHVLRENLLCFVLATGIVCPRTSRKLPNGHEEPGEPFGDEAREYVYDILMQREVKFEACSMDRLGNLIGWITLPSEVTITSGSTTDPKKTSKSKDNSFSSNNLSVILVARGYASVNKAPNTQRSNHYNSLLNAESFAQKHNLGLWSSPEFRAARDAQQDNEIDRNKDMSNGSSAACGFMGVDELQDALLDTEANSKTAATRLKCANPAQVKSISNPITGNDGLRFFVQLNSQADLLASIDDQLNSPAFLVDNLTNLKRGTICAARRSEDNRWYRARILNFTKKNATVVFIDCGNEETIDTNTAGSPRLSTLPKNHASQEPLAKGYRLAYIRLPPDSDAREAAIDYFNESTQTADIRISPVAGPGTPCGKKDTRPAVSAFVYVASSHTAGSSSSLPTPDFRDLGEDMLRNGLVYMENIKMPVDVCARYSEAQKVAISGRKKIWCYGDFRDDDME